MNLYTTANSIIRELRKPGDVLAAVTGAHDMLYVKVNKSDLIVQVRALGGDGDEQMGWVLRVPKHGHERYIDINYGVPRK